MNWKLIAAAMLVFMAAGCGKKTAITVENALGEWEITELSLVNPSGTETPLTPMPLAPGGTMALSLAPGDYTLKATDEEDNDYSTPFTVASEAATVKVEFRNCLGFDETVAVTDGEYWSGSGDGLISITNDLSGYSIYWVNVVEAGGDLYWDADEYCHSVIVYNGETLNVLIEPGTYDIQIVDNDGDTYTRYGVEITRTPYEWTLTLDQLDYLSQPEGTAPVTIVNDLGSWNIWCVYCDPSSDPSWGADRLGASILYAGEETTFYVAPGTYDMHCIDEDDDTYTLWDVNVPQSGYTWRVTLDQMD